SMDARLRNGAIKRLHATHSSIGRLDEARSNFVISSIATRKRTLREAQLGLQAAIPRFGPKGTYATKAAHQGSPVNLPGARVQFKRPRATPPARDNDQGGRRLGTQTDAISSHGAPLGRRPPQRRACSLSRLGKENLSSSTKKATSASVTRKSARAFRC